MGYITLELTGKFPDYLSPAMNLKFADIPNGLEVSSLLVAVDEPEVRRHSQRAGSSVQGASVGLGADGGLRWLLRARWPKVPRGRIG